MQHTENIATNFFNYFRESQYGQNLKTKIRFGIYKPAEMANEEYTKILGVDTNNLNHMPLCRGIASAFCKNNEYLPIHTEVLKDANLLHDIGEAFSKDEIKGFKTKEGEKKEIAGYQFILDKFAKEKNIHLQDYNYLKYLADNVIYNTNTLIGRAFNTIERIGYLRTGLTAFDKSQDTSYDQKFRANLEWLTLNVVYQEITPLIIRTHGYPAVGNYLQENKKRISNVFDSLNVNEISKLYLTLESEKNKLPTDLSRKDYVSVDHFQKSKYDWKNFAR